MRSIQLLALVLALPLGASGQLPFLDAPTGTLRISLSGTFDPAFREYADGSLRDLGAPLSLGETTPLLRDLQTRVSGLLGRAANPGSLGSLSAALEYQRGTGTVGLAVGVTPRITVGVNVPIVSVRTQAALLTDATSATLGVNPASAGDPSSGQYVAQFEAALAQLEQRLTAGEYDLDPDLRAAAIALGTTGAALRLEVASLLTDPVTASPVLPLAASADGQALVAITDAVRDELTNRFGITGFTSSIALPTSAISDAGLSALLGSPIGYDLAATAEPPLVALGDLRVGATVRLLETPALRVWGQAGVRLPTGTAPRVRFLRDQGTGEREFAIDLAGTVEAQRGALGIRGTATITRPFASDREVRVGRLDELLLPASRTTTLRRTSGRVLRVEAQPFVRIAPSFALFGHLGYHRSGDVRWEAGTLTDVTSGGDISTMGVGSGTTQVNAGIGLSYAHDGVNKDGVVKMPVEAGFGLMRVVSSGSGLVADRLTTAVWFRVYKRLFNQ